MVVWEENPLLVFSVTWHVVNVSDTFYPQRSLVSYRIEHAKAYVTRVRIIVKKWDVIFFAMAKPRMLSPNMKEWQL